MELDAELAGGNIKLIYWKGGGRLLEKASIVMQPEKMLMRDLKIAVVVGGVKILLWIMKA